LVGLGVGGGVGGVGYNGGNAGGGGGGGGVNMFSDDPNLYPRRRTREEEDGSVVGLAGYVSFLSS
jgi:hypothetical protein